MICAEQHVCLFFSNWYHRSFKPIQQQCACVTIILLCLIRYHAFLASSKSPCIQRTAGKHLFWPLSLNMFIQRFSSSAICQNATMESRVFVDEGCNLLTGTRDTCEAKFKGKFRAKKKKFPIEATKATWQWRRGNKVERSLTSQAFKL